jgi:hypothetical protein
VLLPDAAGPSIAMTENADGSFNVCLVLQPG